MHPQQPTERLSAAEACTSRKGLGFWRQTLSALVLTLGLFVLLPFSHVLSRHVKKADLSIRPVSTVPVKVEPPRLEKSVIQPPPPKPRELVQSQPRPKPELPSVQPRPRITLPYSLNLATAPGIGDFALDFAFDIRAESPPPAPPTPPSTYGIDDDLDQPPRAIRQTPPVYPYWGRAGNVEGFVDIEFTVSADGSVENIQIIDAFPAGEAFARVSRRAVAAWLFEPGRKNGRAVPVRMRVKLKFELR